MLRSSRLSDTERDIHAHLDGVQRHAPEEIFWSYTTRLTPCAKSDTNRPRSYRYTNGLVARRVSCTMKLVGISSRQHPTSHELAYSARSGIYLMRSKNYNFKVSLTVSSLHHVLRGPRGSMIDAPYMIAGGYLRKCLEREKEAQAR